MVYYGFTWFTMVLHGLIWFDRGLHGLICVAVDECSFVWFNTDNHGIGMVKND